MISEIHIENFKSIADLTLGIGGVTVLIGENGSGKSNILEAIAFAAAASADKLDDEFLSNRGIRITERPWMRSQFVQFDPLHAYSSPVIHLRVVGSTGSPAFDVEIKDDESPTDDGEGRWRIDYPVSDDDVSRAVDGESFNKIKDNLSELVTPQFEHTEKIRSIFLRAAAQYDKRLAVSNLEVTGHLRDFLIYAPENSVLRNFETEGHIRPLGTKGEGLLKLLSKTAASGNGHFAEEIDRLLGLLGWFHKIKLPDSEDEFRGRVELQDRWLGSSSLFDQRSANEGFLYLLFYFTLFLSKQTPRFFAIDNIDNALNPKLCAELMRQLAALSKKTGKQVICTTHNPAVLDGLNLLDDNQRLYVVRRDSDGRTVVNRVKAPRHGPEVTPMRLSEAFMAGLLGGLPEHF